MAVVGFNFTSITASRDAAMSGKVTINNNVSILEMSESNVNLGNTQKALKVDFSYKTDYLAEKKVGNIDILGNLLYLLDEKKATETLEAWKKSRKVDQSIMLQIINTTLNKCNIQALMIADTVGLPAPLKLPQAKIKEPEITATPISNENKSNKKAKK